MVLSSSITIKKPGIARHGNMSRQKAFLQTYIAMTAPMQTVAYKGPLGQQKCELKQAYKKQSKNKSLVPKKFSWSNDLICFKYNKRGYFKKDYCFV